MKILLAITFVYGVIDTLRGTILFRSRSENLLESIFNYKVSDANKSITVYCMLYLDVWFYYFSLVFQSWYWLFK